MGQFVMICLAELTKRGYYGYRSLLFSGTGNSLHVAKELQKRDPETNIIAIVGLLDNAIIETRGEIVGIVFPIHLAMAPAPVMEFLKKLDLKSADYIFALATRAGSPHRAFIDLDKILKKKGKSLDSFFTLNMASNDPKFEDWPPGNIRRNCKFGI
jgi:hypothetical protein